MTQRLSAATLALLVTPPLMWAGNAVVGRLVHTLVPPMTLNLLRWALALLILLPLSWRVLGPQSALWTHWRRFSVLGLLGVGCYNSLQYLALQTSTPLNVTLVGASAPIWMLVVGAVFFGQRISPLQLVGALLSIAGVLVVLSRGDLAQLLAIHLVPGDFYILLATLAWAFYSWLLSRTTQPADIRGNWAALLTAQMAFGLVWSG
ncbi:MAG: EamA family transporter, partial [Haliea sp.]